MTTFIGTSHFVNKASALRYYKSQGYDAASVDGKLAEGAISIGRPEVNLGDVLLTNSEGRYVLVHDPVTHMRSIRVLFEDPKDNYETTINGDRRTICEYFANEPLNLGTGGEDRMVRAAGVVFLDFEKHHTVMFPKRGDL